jgi:hypothetical protein
VVQVVELVMEQAQTQVVLLVQLDKEIVVVTEVYRHSMLVAVAALALLVEVLPVVLAAVVVLA